MLRCDVSFTVAWRFLRSRLTPGHRSYSVRGCCLKVPNIQIRSPFLHGLWRSFARACVRVRFHETNRRGRLQGSSRMSRSIRAHVYTFMLRNVYEVLRRSQMFSDVNRCSQTPGFNSRDGPAAE